MAKYAIEIKNLVKKFGALRALKGLDLTVEKGEFFALLGPNGAGKSTTINILCSLANKTSGMVKINGYNIDSHPSEAKSFLGIVPQEFNFSIFETPLQVLIYQAGYYGIPRKLAKERAEKYLKLLSLWHKKDVQSRKLSGGMKRRLMIARALMHEPKILILDEPTAGVDIEIRHSMWELLKKLNEEGITIILTTHYLEEAESLCKRVAIIKEGEIIECASMKSITKKLNCSVFVIDLENTISTDVGLKDLEVKVVDSNTIEVTVPKHYSLNDVFKIADKNGLVISDIRNKTNKLEQLFLKLTA